MSQTHSISEFQENQTRDKKQFLRAQSTIDETESQNFPGSKYSKRSLTGPNLWMTQFYALLVKRFIYSKRRFVLFGILFFVPMVLAILNMTLSNGQTNISDFEPLELNVDTYPDAIYYYNTQNASMVNDTLIQSYKTVTGDHGEEITEKNTTEFYIKKGEEDINQYRTFLIGGLEITQVNRTLNHYMEKKY